MKPGAIARALEAHGLLELAQEVAAQHHVTINELLGRSRYRPEALARRDLWLRAYALVPSLPRLGQIFDRDHTSILSAIQQTPMWRPRARRGRCTQIAPTFPAEGIARCVDDTTTRSSKARTRSRARVRAAKRSRRL